jgi:hypothetical protein
VTDEEAREVFLGCENDSRALCCAFRLGGFFDEIRRKAADVGDAFAQAVMAEQTNGDESFQTAKGERDGFYWLGRCYEHGIRSSTICFGLEELLQIGSLPTS